jgi:hypothetical protein
MAFNPSKGVDKILGPSRCCQIFNNFDAAKSVPKGLLEGAIVHTRQNHFIWVPGRY